MLGLATTYVLNFFILERIIIPDPWNSLIKNVLINKKYAPAHINAINNQNDRI